MRCTLLLLLLALGGAAADWEKRLALQKTRLATMDALRATLEADGQQEVEVRKLVEQAGGAASKPYVIKDAGLELAMVRAQLSCGTGGRR